MSEPAAAGPLPGPPQPLVELRGITKQFPGVLANDRIDLSLYPGEVHALLGENGAGKSTLIGILAGLQRPDRGEIRIRGAAVVIDSPRRALQLGIGTVFQHVMLVPSLTVVENLMLGSRWWQRQDRAAVAARFRALSAAFGIAIPPDAVTGTLSLGEQQQVEIVRALWRGEGVLVLDEPTSMLTPAGIAQLGQLMGRLKQRGIAIVFITHKLQEAIAFGDRVSVLRRGRLVGQLDPAELASAGAERATARIVGLMFGTEARPAGSTPAEAPPHRAAAAGRPAPVVLEVRNLSLRQGGHPVLDDLSFAVHAGEIFGIAGIDGNGQKPLAELLAGQRPVQHGRISLDGRPIEALSVHQRRLAGLRYLTDDRLGEGTVAGFPVATNLVLKQIGDPPFWRHGIARPARIEEQARRLIAAFDVRTPGPATPIGKLSGGNIQKALLARELGQPARAIIYNKPTHGLDLENTRAAQARIRAAAAAGIATILISTELDELLELSDRIGVLLRGRLTGIVANDAGARERVGQLMVGVGAA